MTITIQRPSADDLRERLAAVLAGVNLSEAELVELAESYTLTPEERAAWDEVRSIRFLLGG